jgi:RHS repeat-associated protein
LNGESVAFGYDGQLVTSDTRSGTLAKAINYTYNNDFAVISVSYAGTTANLGYDNDGLLTAVGTYAISRNTQNGLPESVSGLGLTQSRSFNGYGELDGSVSSVGGTQAYSWSVPARDNAGRILRREEYIDGTTVVWEYSYNAVGRLTEVKKDGVVAESYTYDANGNRLTEEDHLRGISLQSYALSIEDHVLSAGTDTYQFDVNGYLMSKTSAEGTTSYAYSSRGELLRVDRPDGNILSYVHDPFGRRISKQVNGSTVEKYLWKDQTTLLAVYDGNDSLLQRFTYADARMPVSMTAGGATYFLLSDQVGTLRAVAESTGAIVKRIDYDSFGNIIADSNPAFTVPFGFAGGLHDRDTGLVRFGFRDYSPELGRFTAKDPIDFAGGDTNLYGYVMSDPVNFVDPSGLYGYGPHLYVPIEAAAEAGMPMEIGRQLGLASQSVDMVRDPMDYRNRGYHFSTTEQARTRVKCARTISELGDAIHTLMDSYSHEGLTVYTSLQVHLWQSLLPDAWDPNSERDQLMYSSVRAAIRSWMKDHPGYSR